MNIDPGTAAEAYRSRVLGQMALTSTEKEVLTVREQLSGACTTEIAAFVAWLLQEAEAHERVHRTIDLGAGI